MAALRSQSLSLSEVKSCPVLFKHVTGLPNYETYAALLRYLAAKARRLKWWRGMVTLREVCAPGGQRRYQFKGERKLNTEEQFSQFLFA